MKKATVIVNLKTSDGLIRSGTKFTEPFPAVVQKEIDAAAGTVIVETVDEIAVETPAADREVPVKDDAGVTAFMADIKKMKVKTHPQDAEFSNQPKKYFKRKTA